MAELIWDGKYKDGKKVAPVRIALPFQTIETVNESTQDRQKSLDMFSTGRTTDWKNRLIWGDKKYVLPSLLSEFSGKVNLVYIDPPFDTGADFSFWASVPNEDPDDEKRFLKQPNIIEQKAYRDTWANYLEWMYETLVLLNDLLAANGNIFVHIDTRQSNNVKLMMDEIFGEENFRNQIIWKRSQPKAHVSNRFSRSYDVILFYSKNQESNFFIQHKPHDQSYVDNFYRYIEPETGRKYRLDNLANPNKDRPNLTYEFPPGSGVVRVWRWTKERMTDSYNRGLVIVPKGGGVASYKRYLDEMEGTILTDLWDDIEHLHSVGQQNVGYPTQKPEELLERIIKACTVEDDLVLDCFSGSGTTAIVAEKLNRRWIASDMGRFSIHTIRKRLLSIDGVNPFTIQNLGKYERQEWQSAEFQEPEKQVEKELKYRKFILDLYKAEFITGFTWLHGVKKDRMIHVGAVDSPVTLSDVKAIAAETWKSVGKGKDAPKKATVDILGWDFALEVNEISKQIAAESGVEVHFKVIPREVLDKKAVEQGDIKFFELASLAVDIKTSGLEVTANLKDFVIPPNDVPEDVQKAIKHWSQWIDYWAIDWDYKNDTFHNEWQSYRSRQSQDLDLTTSHTYETPGEYQVVVKVIDILGNDTTKLLKVQVSDAKKKK